MLIIDSFTGLLFEISVALLAIVIIYYKWSFQYWKRKNVPYLEPSIPYGNTKNPIYRKENSGVRIKGNYDVMRAKGWKHGGLYFMTRPIYLVVDLDYVKNIMTKDFQHFVDRGFHYNEEKDPLSAHLFAIGGPKWRNLRTKLTPTFTSGKMKMMFQTLTDCEPSLLKKIQSDCSRNEPIDIKEVLGCFTTDIIGSCAFGLDCNTFQEDNSPFRTYGKKIFTMSKKRMILGLLATTFPNLAKKLKLVTTPQDVTDFFVNVVKDTVKYREENNVTRRDFMQLLIDLKNNKLEGDGQEVKYDGKSLTIEEVAAQSFVFFIAGFETSSTTMTFALYELSKQQQLQEKLREEVKSVLAKHGGNITYEAIQDMKYMDQVLNETLRKYPPLPFLTRKCVKDYKIPDQDVIIEEGTSVFIPVLGIHYDKEYYPDPEKFDPERFSEENKKTRHSYAHIPFGEGPRICIGMRFGWIQSKVGLASLLNKYRFTVNKKTHEPLKMKVNSFVLAAEGEIWLDAHTI